MRCPACNNKLKLIGNRCGACGSSISSNAQNTVPEKVPTANQVSGNKDEPPFKCPSCGSFNIHFCNIRSSLRCRKCNGSLSYEEGVSWWQ